MIRSKKPVDPRLAAAKIGQPGETDMGQFQDLTGKRFGKLIVIKRAENNWQGRPRWLCQCDCGRETRVGSGDLKTTRSCGCLKGKHGHSWPVQSPTYHSWRAGMTLDRKKNHLNYTPKNCRWATLKQQRVNRRVDCLGRR